MLEYMQEEKLYSVKIKKTKSSEVEITGEIAESLISTHKKTVLDKAREDIVVPGFRKGLVPNNILMTKLNEYEVLQEAAELALNEVYPQIIKENELDVLGIPEVSITKLAPGNPMEFQIKVGLVPEIKLPDYKEIAKKTIKKNKTADVEITDKDIEEVVGQILKMRRTDEDKPQEELTDEFVKTLGQFENVADFKEKLKENIKKEKEVEAKKGLRNEILKDIVEATKIELPEVMVKRETEEVHRRFLKELEENKTTLEDYLKKVGRSEEDIKKQHEIYVEQTLKSRLILDDIARKENITADEAEIEKNVEFLLMRNPESDKNYLNHYVRTVLTNEAVIDFLEDSSKKE